MISLQTILQQSGVDVRVKGDEWNICCPFCAENGKAQDQAFKLGINVQQGIAHCFHCGWGGHNREWIARELCRIFVISVRRGSRQQTITPRHRTDYNGSQAPRNQSYSDIQPAGLPAEYEFVMGADPDGAAQPARDYLRSRGISIYQIVKHQVGFAVVGRMAGRVLFPIYGTDGKVYGCAGRDYTGQATPKYLNTSGMKLLWNGHNAPGRTVVLVEGVMDALAVERALLSSPQAVIAAARLGSGITSMQIGQLKHAEKVILIPDHDEAGIKAAQMAAAKCSEAAIQVKVCVPERMTGRDPGDMDEEELRSILASAMPWNHTTENRLRMAATKKV